MFQAHAAARIAHELPPAERESSFHAYPGPDLGRQHLVAVGSVLLTEPLDAWHGYDPGLDAVRFEQLASAEREVHFAARGDENDVGLGGAREYVAAPGRALSAGDVASAAQHSAVEHRQILSA